MAWYVGIDFGAGLVDVTLHCCDAVKSQRLHNDLHSTVDWCTLTVTDADVANDLLAADNYCPITITKDTVPWFKGFVRPNYSVQLGAGFDELAIECVDAGILLQKRIETPISYSAYKVCDTANKAASILHQLFYAAGFADGDLSLTTIDTTLAVYAVDPADELTYWDALDILCYEHGYVWLVTNAGVVTLVDLFPTSYSPGAIADADAEHGLMIQKQERQYEAVRITWHPQQTLTDRVVFEDTTGGDGKTPCNLVFPADSYYPEGSETGDVYCEYRLDDYDIIKVDSAALDIAQSGVATQTFTPGYKRALLKLYSASGGVVTRLRITGNATVRDKCQIRRSIRYVVAASTRILDYEALWIAAIAGATRLSNGIARWLEFADFTYQFGTDAALAPGSIATFTEASILGLTTDVRVVEVQEDDQGNRRVTAEGMDEYTAVTPTVQNSVGAGAAWGKYAGRVIVAAAGYQGGAHYFCDGTADQAEIQAAIDYLVATYGGGTVELIGGDFATSGAISLLSGVTIYLGNCTITKNCADYAIEAIGTEETPLHDVAILGPGTITRDSGDTSDQSLVCADYVSGFNMELVKLLGPAGAGSPPGGSVRVYGADRAQISHCSFVNFSRGVFANLSVIAICDCVLTGTLTGASSNSGIRCSGGTVTVSRNHFVNIVSPTALFAISVSYGSGTCIVSDNEFVNVVVNTSTDSEVGDGTVIDIDADGAKVSNNQVIDYSGGGFTYQAIYVVGGSDILVSENYCRNNGNLIDRGNCESATPPAMLGETSVTLNNCTFDRSDEQANHGTYSRKMVKTVAAGTGANAVLTDNTDTTDMHGFIAGKTYTKTAFAFVPSTGGPAASEVRLLVAEYYSGTWHYTELDVATVQDEFEELTGTFTVNAATTGCYTYMNIMATAEDTEYCWFDDIRVRPDGVGNDHSQQFVDAGTGTLTNGNSWEL